MTAFLSLDLDAPSARKMQARRPPSDSDERRFRHYECGIRWPSVGVNEKTLHLVMCSGSNPAKSTLDVILFHVSRLAQRLLAEAVSGTASSTGERASSVTNEREHVERSRGGGRTLC